MDERLVGERVSNLKTIIMIKLQTPLSRCPQAGCCCGRRQFVDSRSVASLTQINLICIDWKWDPATNDVGHLSIAVDLESLCRP
jgi:hypothetical protein